MKHFALAVFMVATSAFAAYALIAFIMFEPDVGKWSTDMRVLCVFATAAFCAAASDHARRNR